MANNCFNYVSFSGENEILKKIEEKFNALKNEGLNYENYHKLFESDMDMSDYDFSDELPKWYHPDDVEFINDNILYINGDSAWTPVTELVGLISEKYKVSANINYEEQGNNFAGEETYNEEGLCILSEEHTYWEGLFKKGDFYDEFESNAEYMDDLDEFFEENDLKDKVDMDKVMEIWNRYHSEEEEENEEDENA